VVTNLSKRWTRRGDLMATFDLEDLSSSIEVMVFPKSMAEHGHKLLDDSVLLVKGRLDSREDSPKLICSELETFDTSSDDSGQSIQVSLPLERVDESTIFEIKKLLNNYPGDVKVFFRLGDRQLLRLSDDFSVDPSNGLIAELRILLGVDSVSFI
jgi:DNA polymerase-3 subunit alpha